MKVPKTLRRFAAVVAAALIAFATAATVSAANAQDDPQSGTVVAEAEWG